MGDFNGPFELDQGALVINYSTHEGLDSRLRASPADPLFPKSLKI